MRRPVDDAIRVLVDLRERQIQKARIQFGNRLSAIARGDDSADDMQKDILKRYFTHFEEMEKQIDKDIMDIYKSHPMYIYMSRIRGIGPQLGAKLLALIDIEEADTISSLWRFAGLAVVKDICPKCGGTGNSEDCDTESISDDEFEQALINGDDNCILCNGTGYIGKAEHKVKGEKIHYSVRLKTTMYNIAISMLRSKSPYAKFYYDAKQKYASRVDANGKPWTKLHIHYAALRKMEQMFLSHLWQVWRKVEGLEITAPYAQGVLGHDSFVSPEEYGWYG